MRLALTQRLPLARRYSQIPRVVSHLILRTHDQVGSLILVSREVFLADAEGSSPPPSPGLSERTEPCISGSIIGALG